MSQQFKVKNCKSATSILVNGLSGYSVNKSSSTRERPEHACRWTLWCRQRCRDGNADDIRNIISAVQLNENDNVVLHQNHQCCFSCDDDAVLTVKQEWLDHANMTPSCGYCYAAFVCQPTYCRSMCARLTVSFTRHRKGRKASSSIYLDPFSSRTAQLFICRCLRTVSINFLSTRQPPHVDMLAQCAVAFTLV